MKTVYKFILILYTILILFSNNNIYASMADFTDQEADIITKQRQEEWNKEQEERINKSSNNYLINLSVNGYNLTPEFDKQTINYEIKKEINNEYIEIEAETDDEKASVSGDGKVMLSSGENELRIDVTAENKTVRSYFIRVKKVVNTEEKLMLEDNQGIERGLEQNQTTKGIKQLVLYSIIIVMFLFIIISITIIKKKHNIGRHS